MEQKRRSGKGRGQPDNSPARFSAAAVARAISAARPPSAISTSSAAWVVPPG
jgi:hypothetical protein